MVPERLEREILIEAPVEVVWSVVTEPEHISGWFGDTAEIELRPGGALRLGWSDQGHTVQGTIETVEPPHFLAYTWRNANPGNELPAGESTLVEFRLSAEGDSTRLKVVESGFPRLSLAPDASQDLADGHRRGWVQELDELREYAEAL
jgi:uncharacterized protein YndB with AHSA1/START domain